MNDTFFDFADLLFSKKKKQNINEWIEINKHDNTNKQTWIDNVEKMDESDTEELGNNFLSFEGTKHKHKQKTN